MEDQEDLFGPNSSRTDDITVSGVYDLDDKIPESYRQSFQYKCQCKPGTKNRDHIVWTSNPEAVNALLLVVQRLRGNIQSRAGTNRNYINKDVLAVFDKYKLFDLCEKGFFEGDWLPNGTFRYAY